MVLFLLMKTIVSFLVVPQRSLQMESEITEATLKHLHRLSDGRFAMEVCDLVGLAAYDRLAGQGKERTEIMDALRLSLKDAPKERVQ
jgi:hypothetical protein